MAEIITRKDFIGVGTLVQVVGLVLMVVSFSFGTPGSVVGFIAFLACFVFGSRMSKTYYCGDCMNRVERASVTVCPVYRAELTEPPQL